MRMRCPRRAKGEIMSNTPIPMPNLPLQEVARFWSKVEKTPTCWLWRGTLHPHGYGIFVYKNRKYRAHRISLTLAGIELPRDRNIHPDHTCQNRACVNPAHIEVVTEQENI